MGLTTLCIATACYVVTAYDLVRQKNWPLALTFAAYALANVGLIVAAYRPSLLSQLR